MLTHEQIEVAVKKMAPAYPIKAVAYFGSYAAGRQTSESDLDLLVAFSEVISIIKQIKFQLDMEDELKMAVDVISYPLAKGAVIEIEKAVQVYGQEGFDFAQKNTRGIGHKTRNT
ncbi:MAG: nucleotidyltransferase domain-containing protein [Defluviitaleaceae bacterium]|nr:nucleotidyltransferase domain-containing protein [Defluviitaleaceae bacterium]